MPSPADLLYQLGQIAANVGNTVAQAVGLGELFSMSSSAGSTRGTFFRFVNNLLKYVPGITRQEASAAYPYARFWANQGEYLSQLPENQIIDRRFAFEVYKDAEDFIPGQNYRYTVATTITFGATGDTKTFYTIVYNPTQATLEEAYGDALTRLIEGFRDGSIPKSLGGTAPEWEIQQSLTQFAIIYMKG